MTRAASSREHRVVASEHLGKGLSHHLPLGPQRERRLRRGRCAGQDRHLLRHIRHEGRKALVDVVLHLAHAEAVQIGAKGVFKLPCNEVETPEDKDTEESEEDAPWNRTCPLTSCHGRCRPVDYEEHLRYRRVRKRKGCGRILHRVVIMLHARPQEMEGSRYDGSGTRQCAIGDVVDNEILYPLVHSVCPVLQLHLAQALKILLLNAVWMEQFIARCLHVIAGLRALQVGQDHGIQQAHKANQKLLEPKDIRVVGGIPSESAEGDH
mmetsp:Transcript_65346/g.173260  ORF Transcript_65346/g.173260 Transcript_65346/m.173260 type:complete len:266 (-) Transcript_65346:225-1022(-)